MNKVILTGYVLRDIELQYTTSKIAVAKFGLAVKRNYKNSQGDYESDFINCITYRKLAETLSKYAKKGDKIGIEGRITTSSYKAKDGTTRYVTEVAVDNIEFLTQKIQKEEIVEEQSKEEIKDVYEEMGEQIQLDESELPF